MNTQSTTTHLTQRLKPNGLKLRYYSLLGLFICLFVAFSQLQAQTFYGTTIGGGTDNIGTIFKFVAGTGSLTASHSMTYLTSGGRSQRNELREFNGKFYGMTSGAGANGYGVIFEWDPATNVYTKKKDFTSIDCRSPGGSLTLFNGKFYGMVTGKLLGGYQAEVVIFEWDPTTNVFTKKTAFNGENTSGLLGSLTLFNGKFYGVTQLGGNGYGFIFEWDPATNVYTKKKDFTFAEGIRPTGSLTLFNGKFYGMTNRGGSTVEDQIGYGVIFEWDPATNVFTKKKDFIGIDGSRPEGNLTLFNGKFYGVTRQGGANNNGVIFEWDPATNVYMKKKDFTDTVGSRPQGSLALFNGKLYGMTVSEPNYEGLIFEWNPATNEYAEQKYLKAIDGVGLSGSMTLSNGKFYGMTTSGGTVGIGVIFEWDPTTNVHTKKKDFNGSNGQNPSGSLTLFNGKFYGLTITGGEIGYGVIFEWDPATNVYIKKKDFTGIDGGFPLGRLTLFNGKFYGVTRQGGANDNWVIFEWDPATNVYVKKKDFNGVDGRSLYGSLTLANGKFYGMTLQGGVNDSGVIFEWDPVTNLYIKKKDFTGIDGSNPYGDLTFFNGKFYGLTYQGGTNNKGVIFEWNQTTNVYTKQKDFTSTIDGIGPFGSLMPFNGKFYGMTLQGGIRERGVIFEWDPATNIYTKQKDFNGIDGSNPSASLTLANGKFYGTTQVGGASDLGVIFEWDPTTNVYIKKGDFTGSNGSNPVRGVLVMYESTDTIQQTIRINAGGTTQTVSDVTWSGCSNLSNCNGDVRGGYPYTQLGNPTISGVTSPLNQAIFQTEWTGGAVGSNVVPQGQVAFSYNIPVVNGTYLIRLHFAELNKNGVGLRVFDVNIEGGAKELVNYDIFKEVGFRTATSKEFIFNIFDGAINIDFIRQIENAKISAIEIIPQALDNIPPTVPVLSLGTVKQTSVALAWTASTDNIDVMAYDVFNGADLVASTSNLNFTVNSLTPNTAYSFTVKAKDGVGNSSVSNTLTTIILATTSTRYEAETSGIVVSDVGANPIRVLNNEIASAGKDLRTYDIGDKIKFDFNVAQTGQYRLKVRARSGISTNPTLYWSPLGYSFKLNNTTTTFAGTNEISATPSNTYGNGGHFGIIASDTLNLNAGANSLEITMTRSWLGVDYLEVEFLGNVSGVANTNQTENAVETRESIILTQDISKLYPNPAGGEDVYVEFSGDVDGKVEYSISDAQGKTYTQQIITLDEPQYVIKIAIANLRLSQGVYYLYIKGDKLLEKTIRFVKN